MSRGDIKAGRAYVELLLKNSAFMKGLQNASKRLTSFGIGVAKIGASIGAAGGLIIAPFVKAIQIFTETGDKLDKMSQRTGVQAASLAELGFAAEQSGTQLDVVEKGINGMTRALLDAERGSKEAVDSLDDIGLSLDDLKGKGVEEQFQMVAGAINDVEGASKRGALAQKLLGRSGRELLPMFGQMEALRKQARDEGLVPTDEAVKKAAVLTDAFNVVRRKVGAAFFEIGAAVSDNVLEAVEVVSGLLTVGIKWVKQNGDLLVTIMRIGAGLVVAGAAIAGIGGAFIAAGAVLSGIATVFTVIGAGIGIVVSAIGFLLSPVGLLVVGLGAAVVAWLAFTDAGRDAGGMIMSTFGRGREIFNEFFDVFNQAFGGIKNALIGGDLELAGEIAMTGLRLVFLKGVDLIASMFGERFGGAIKDIGLLLSGGDFSGAWEEIVGTMGNIWDSFVGGIVSAFAGAAKKVIELWSKTTQGIANHLLESSAKGGFSGQVASTILGVDMQKEIERGKKLDAKLGLDPTDILGDAKQFSADQITATADAIKQRIEDEKKKRLPGPSEPDEGGPDSEDGFAAEMARLQAMLLGLRRESALKAAEAFKMDESEELGQRGQTFASSNVYAALVAGRAGGGSKEDRMLKAAEDQRELMKKVAGNTATFNGGLAALAGQIAMSRIKMK